MNMPSRLSSTILTTALTLALSVSAASAAEHDIRIVPQILAGTAGVEPGVALEWRGLDQPLLVVRPEVFINEDAEIGAGGSVLFDISSRLDLQQRHAVAVGPRLVYHNSDQYGWEADVMATWSYDLMSGNRSWQHSVGALGALGLADDKKHDEMDLGASVGIFYAYGF